MRHQEAVEANPSALGLFPKEVEGFLSLANGVMAFIQEIVLACQVTG